MLHVITLSTRTGTGLQYVERSHNAKIASIIHPNTQPFPMNSIPEMNMEQKKATFTLTADLQA
jgi:hypothetical protein